VLAKKWEEVVSTPASPRVCGKHFVEQDYAVLYGQYRCSIDIKNRLLIPAVVRKQLDPQRDGTAFFIVTGDNGKLWLYAENVYKGMAKGAPQKLAPSERELEFDHLHYALAEHLEWDKTGRVLLPDDQMKETGTGKDIVLFGARNHLEIWNRPDWEAHREGLRARRKEISQLAENRTDQGT
jgi:MraZ protein